jgi:xanthine dehydrogenase accessory factor
MKEICAILEHLTAPDSAGGVLATLVAVKGSSYRRPGARLLVTAEGLAIGSISGGCLEEDVIARARIVADSGQTELVTYDTTSENDLIWGVGLGCHGVVEVLLEKISPRAAWITTLASNLRGERATELATVWRNSADPAGQSSPPLRLGSYLAAALPSLPGSAAVFFQRVRPPSSLVIFGAGNDVLPLVRFAKELGWHVTVADPRPAFATAARFPGADAIVVAPATELVTRAGPGPDALAVVMTHHYIHDLPLIRALLPRPLTYLGLLGPRQRAEKILADLARDGVELTPETRGRLHAPVGLNLGAETPAEVALAILAEMQAALAGRDARPLSELNRPIHA